VRQRAHDEDNRAACRSLLRLSDSGAMMGGMLFLVWGYVHRPDLPLYLKAVVAVASLAVPILFLTALMGLYALCRDEAGRLGETGIVLGMFGSAVGIVRSVVDVAVPTLYPHNAASGRILLLLGVVWAAALFVGLILVGSALLVRASARRALGVLLLAMGASGWAFLFTDSGAIFETRSVHIGFGILFSLGWMTLGLALRAGGALRAKEPHA
jgi:hypothetical protein